MALHVLKNFDGIVAPVSVYTPVRVNVDTNYCNRNVFHRGPYQYV